jgi:hypothetical protein
MPKREFSSETTVRRDVDGLVATGADQVLFSLEPINMGLGEQRLVLLALAIQLFNERGYRLVSHQQPLGWNVWTAVFEKRAGSSLTNRSSAPPGESEHISKGPTP